MPLVRLTQGPARAVADFPEDAKRTSEGALHLAPGIAKEITEDEAAHLKAKYGHLPLMFIHEQPGRVAVPPTTKTSAKTDAAKDKKE